MDYKNVENGNRTAEIFVVEKPGPSGTTRETIRVWVTRLEVRGGTPIRNDVVLDVQNKNGKGANAFWPL